MNLIRKRSESGSGLFSGGRKPEGDAGAQDASAAKNSSADDQVLSLFASSLLSRIELSDTKVYGP